MKKHIINVNTAEIPIRLKFHDSALYQEVSSILPDYNSTATPILTMDIHTPGPSTQSKQHTCLINGYGEYTCNFNINNGNGSINLTSQSPCAALTNCLRQIYTQLILMNNGLVLHAACIFRNSTAYIFAGKSGAGKSTICKLSHDCTTASDDLTAVRQTDKQFMAWGLPCANKTLQASKTGPFPVKAIFTLVQAKTNRLKPAKNAQTMAQILAIPASLHQQVQPAKILEFLKKMTDNIPSYELHFKKDSSFWKCIDSELGLNKK